MPGKQRVRIKGLRECTRAFAAINHEVQAELTAGLKEAAEPVRVVAEQYAVDRIRNMDLSPQWAEQKTAVGQRTGLVYMAPKKRQTRVTSRKRKNLAELLMGRAMEPALEDNTEKVIEKVDKLLDELGRKNGF